MSCPWIWDPGTSGATVQRVFGLTSPVTRVYEREVWALYKLGLLRLLLLGFVALWFETV